MFISVFVILSFNCNLHSFNLIYFINWLISTLPNKKLHTVDFDNFLVSNQTP